MISVLGAGVAGLCAATALRAHGLAVEVIAPEGVPAASLLAGGMLAPFCEGDGAPAEVVAEGQAALAWWQARAKSYAGRGTLVVAPVRDGAELARFARATTGHIAVDLAAYEPDLAGRFAFRSQEKFDCVGA